MAKKKAPKGPTGGPMTPGSGPKPKAMDRPAAGCNPAVDCHPTSAGHRKRRMNGSGC